MSLNPFGALPHRQTILPNFGQLCNIRTSLRHSYYWVKTGNPIINFCTTASWFEGIKAVWKCWWRWLAMKNRYRKQFMGKRTLRWLHAMTHNRPQSLWELWLDKHFHCRKRSVKTFPIKNGACQTTLIGSGNGNQSFGELSLATFRLWMLLAVNPCMEIKSLYIWKGRVNETTFHE